MMMKEVLKKVGSQTGWQLFGKIITSVITLILLSLISRSYGESGIGIYTLAITYLGFFFLAGDLGVNAYGIRFFEKSPIFFNKILGFRIVHALLLVIIAIAGSFIFLVEQPLVFWSIILGSFSIIGSAFFVTTNLVFQSKLRYDLSVIATIVSSIVVLAIVLLFILFQVSLPYLLIGQVIGWFICGLIGMLLVRRFVSVKPDYDFSFNLKMMTAYWPVSFTLLLNVIYFRIDTFIITFSRGIVDVGVYNLAYQFFSNALVFPTFIMNALYPLFVKVHQKSEKALLPFMIKSGLIMGTIGFIGTIVTYILSPFIIRLVAGDSGFEGSIEVLRILSFSFPAFFLSAVLMWGLVALNLNKIMLTVYVIGLVVNLILNLIYIPQYSYIAASWVTVFCEYLILLLQLVILIRYFKS